MQLLRMPPKDDVSRRSSTSSRSEGHGRHSSATRQLITFVDSQDPNSRSTIQRHTAHHSNAQRRDARLQSLRRNRPRVLEWQRRPSVETDTLSPHSSTSSASISPAPGLRTVSAPSEISAELTTLASQSLESAIIPSESQTELSGELNSTSFEDSVIETYFRGPCAHVQVQTYKEVVRYIRTIDTASTCLLIAYILALRSRDGEGPQSEIDSNDAQTYYGRGTRLLRDRLTNPETASSDQNIQAVLLLVAYASDVGSPEEVTIHVSALRRMVRQRGGLQSLSSTTNTFLLLQLRTIGTSRKDHLTLDCGAACVAQRRFPSGLEII